MSDNTLRIVTNLGSDANIPASDISASITLSYEQRVKGRLLASDDKGRDVGLFLERGKTLREGDILKSEDGQLLQVRAQNEALREAKCDNWLTFAKAVYHLGNRHVPVEINELRLKIQPDAILEEMLQVLGLEVAAIDGPFNPESGAYSGGHHHHH
ncbi:MAG: urease accessory protein UreE [Oleiphilaceae bacterium]|nr:urease accessory protein UreE [Oleiphilaceae bacterium]